jgi:hypothetical protein
MLRLLALALFVIVVSGSALTSTRPPTAAPIFEVIADGLGSARGIVVNDDDQVYVADREAGTVVRLDAGVRRVVARRLDRPIGLALDPFGRVLVAEERAGRVVRLDPSGPTLLAQGIKQPRWLAGGDDGTIYIAARRLTRDADPEPDDESLEPEVILALTTDGILSIFADGFDHLQGIAVQHDAVFAVTTGLRGTARQSGVVFRIPIRLDGRAGPLERVGPRDVFERPIGLAIDRLGALYVSSPEATLDGVPRSRQSIVKLATASLTPTLFTTGLDGPRGLAFDQHGHLYVADAGRVVRFLAPSAPRLAALPPFTAQPTITLAGTSIRDARVDVLVNDAVMATVDAASNGAFSATLPLAPGVNHHLQAFATAARGMGLTSPPAESRVVRDAMAPSLVMSAPSSGAYVRGAIPLRADATDTSSGVAALGLSVAGQSLSAPVTPSLPAAAASASAVWDTARVADGTHTLTASASDRAGNVATATRLLIVDNTPPETDILPDDGDSPPYTFTFRGTDNLAPPESLQFAWRLDGGPWTAFTSATTATLGGLTPDLHVVEVIARDPAGNEDPTPARASFAVSGLAIAVTSPSAGVSIADDATLMTGTVSDPSGTAAVSVNGRPALVRGTQWAVEVPIEAGDNLLVATALGRGGEQATASVTITGLNAVSAVRLSVEPGTGLAPLPVIWRISSRGTRPLVRFELDRLGTGAFGEPVAQLDGTSSVYEDAGLWIPTVRATDEDGHVYLARAAVQVDDSLEASRRFQALWADFLARLRAADHSGASAFLSRALQPRFAEIAQQLGADLAMVAGALPGIELIDQVADLAEGALVQTEDGIVRLYFVYFRRDNLGRWLIHEM